jgi:hypothetical protein
LAGRIWGVVRRHNLHFRGKDHSNHVSVSPTISLPPHLSWLFLSCHSHLS